MSGSFPGSAAPGDDEDAWCAASAPGGYAWWYVDVSDGQHVLTVILFAGAVFSPRYAERVRSGAADRGLDHPAVHISLVELGKKAARPLVWVMNEYPAGALLRLPGGLGVAKSSLWQEPDGTLRLSLCEETTRFFARPGPLFSGEIRIRPGPSKGRVPLPPVRLSPEGAPAAHDWRPRVLGGSADATLSIGGRPLQLSGAAYHDGNFGSGRLERTFDRWSWAHGTDAERGEAVVLYDVAWQEGGGLGLLLREDGSVLRAPAAPSHRGASPLSWLSVPAGFSVGERRCQRQRGALLDAPFYSRFPVHIEGGDRTYAGIGEHLDLQRFSARWVQFLLRYKTRSIEDNAL